MTQTSDLFEGGDFKTGAYKPLTPEYYPEKYQAYIKEETELLIEKCSGKKRVLEAGVGIGRLIPILAPLVGEFVAVDNAQFMIEKSQNTAKDFSNVTIQKCELEELSKKFDPKFFDVSLCVWNTLGNVKDEVTVLKELKAITAGSIIVTVYKKGTIEDRKNWYSTIGMTVERIDEQNEIFYIKNGPGSKAYSLEDLQNIGSSVGLSIAEHKVLNGVMNWVEYHAI